jgi:ABC-type transporter Mla subunit MlaD
MARQKRNSTILTYAEHRLVALEAIDTTLDLGDGLSVEAISQAIAATRAQLKSYNAALTEADHLKEAMQQKEQALEELVDRMASGIAAKYGKTSQQYKTVSNVRKTPRRNATKVEAIQPVELSA